jgi:basic membrane protein A and related proteins
MLLVQAGASGTHPALSPSPTAATVCASTFRIGFVTDVAGLRSSVDAAGWRGVGEALAEIPCGHADLALPTRPSNYRATLEADAGYDLVIAGSFLLTDPVVDIARANPATHFLLVDPLVVPSGPQNLAVLAFRDDQAAYLAGALAGIMTQTGVVAGVYGPAGAIDTRNRLGFEQGARDVRPGVRVLGAYQPAQDGAPYANPAWGAAQARAFSGQNADVVFGAGGTTGQGALLGAAQSGRLCIGAGVDPATDQPAPTCLLGTTIKWVDAALKDAVLDAAAGRWAGGVRTLGVAEAAVGLSLLADPRLTPEIRQRLQAISDRLATGSLSTGR